MESAEAMTVDDIDIFRAAEMQHRCKRGAVSHLIDGSLDNWGEAPGGFKWHENEPAPVGGERAQHVLTVTACHAP